jgi:hypothetical protein
VDDALKESLGRAFDPGSLDLQGVERSIRARSRCRTRTVGALAACVCLVLVGAGVLLVQNGSSPKVRATDRGATPTAPTAGPAGWTSISMDQRVFPGIAPIKGIAQWRGDLYAVGNSYGSANAYGAEPVVWKSDDGRHWTKVWDNGSFALGSLSDQSFLPTSSRLLLFDRHNFNSEMWESTDGSTWMSTPQPWGESAIDRVAAIGDRIVATVGGSGGGPFEVWISLDGTTWSRSSFDFGTTDLGALAVVSGEFVMGGGDAAGLPALWTSTDAEHWVEHVVTQRSGSVTAIGGDKDVPIAAIRAGDTTTMWSSTGGAWKQAAIAGPKVAYIDLVLSVQHGFVAITAGGRGRTTLLASVDGIARQGASTWQPLPMPQTIFSVDALAPYGDGLLLFASQHGGEGFWQVAVNPLSAGGSSTTETPPRSSRAVDRRAWRSRF